MVCDCGLGDLGQDFQEQKRSSPALVPLEIPSKPWPCAFFGRAERKEEEGGRGEDAPRRAPKSWLIRVRLLVPSSAGVSSRAPCDRLCVLAMFMLCVLAMYMYM